MPELELKMRMGKEEDQKDGKRNTNVNKELNN